MCRRNRLKPGTQRRNPIEACYNKNNGKFLFFRKPRPCQFLHLIRVWYTRCRRHHTSSAVLPSWKSWASMAVRVPRRCCPGRAGRGRQNGHAGVRRPFPKQRAFQRQWFGHWSQARSEEDGVAWL